MNLNLKFEFRVLAPYNDPRVSKAKNGRLERGEVFVATIREAMRGYAAGYLRILRRADKPVSKQAKPALKPTKAPEAKKRKKKEKKVNENA